MVGLMFSATQEWHGGKVSRAVNSGASIGARKAAERLRGLAVALAPKDTGFLRLSGAVKAIPGEPSALVVFDTPYAVRQHEELDWKHNDGQAKYLEQPLEEHRSELMSILGKEIRVAITNS